MNHDHDRDEALQRAAAAESNEPAEVVWRTGGGDQGQARHPAAVGPYRVVETLGEGGMGAVYLAEQTEPLRRRVAVKLIRPDVVGSEAVLRFEAERQALARLSHVNVAQVHEAGTTAEGQPFIVMEYVPGQPINAYCDEHRLDLARRLELFAAVCRGVQHAHQKGIIHRDIKGSNILVTVVDGEPVPKIIDFGIAKGLDQPLVERTLLTGDQIMGTPAYMSPECLNPEGGPDDVDTRADVYALGVLLYRLLVGVRPFGEGGDSLLKIVMDIQMGNVMSPSARFRSLDEASRADKAAARGADAAPFGRQLEGDLDWITMKAMASDREQRYGSAAELADDLARHLSHEPVLASPPSALYRAQKLLRRHRAAVAATLLVASALLLGITGTSIGLVRARRAEARAQAEAERASREAATAQRVADFLVGLFEIADPIAVDQPGQARGETITAGEILKRGTEKLRTELAQEPGIRAELLNIVGGVYVSLGLYDLAQELVEEGLDIRLELHGEQHQAVLESRHALAGVLHYKGDYDAAEPLYRQCLEVSLALTDEPDLQVAEIQGDLARLLQHKGDYDGAEPLMRRALATFHRLVDGDDPSLAISLNNLAWLLRERGDLEGAEPLMREALAMNRRLHGQQHPSVALGLNDLGLLLRDRGDLAGAEPLLREAVEMDRRILGDEHPRVAIELSNLALVLQDRGDLEGAERLMREVLAMDRKLLGEQHPDVAWDLANLGTLLQEQGEPGEARRLIEEALEMRRRLLGEHHPMVARSLCQLASLNLSQAQHAEAESLIRQALDIFRGVLPNNHWRIADAEGLLGASLAGLGRREEAEQLLLTSYETLRSVKGERSRVTREVGASLVRLYEEWGRPDKAAAYRLPE